MTRAARRVAAVVVLAGALVGVFASPASAHATLLESTPQPGEVLQRVPRAVTLAFSESVEATLGAIRVYDDSGERIGTDDVEQPSGGTVRVALPRLDDGTYVVTWRVASADSHPAAGTFTFQVGNAGNATSRESQELAQQLLAGENGDRVVGALFGVTRGVGFGGLAMLLGGAVFATLIWPRARHLKIGRRLVWAGWAATAAATALGLLLQGPYVQGRSVGDVFDLGLLGDVLGTRFGEVGLFRLLLLAAAIPLLLSGRARCAPGYPVRGRSAAPVAGTVVAVGLAATPGLAGHAVTGDWVPAAMIADTLHILAMSVWLGGLVVLAAIVLRQRDANELRGVVPRFSRVAMGSVAALVITGGFQAWRQVGSLDALRTTDYGRILVVKLVVFAAAVVCAVFSREIVARLFPQPHRRARGLPVVAGGADDWLNEEPDDELDEATELRHLRGSVWAEVVFAVGVLVATALLVNAVPAKTAAAASTAGGVVGVTMKSSQVWVDVTVTPGVAGRNDLHVSVLAPTGALRDVPEVTLTFAQPERDIAPLEVPLRRLGPGHYLSPGFDIPFAAEWRVTARPRLDDFNQPILVGTVTIC